MDFSTSTRRTNFRIFCFRQHTFKHLFFQQNCFFYTAIVHDEHEFPSQKMAAEKATKVIRFVDFESSCAFKFYQMFTIFLLPFATNNKHLKANAIFSSQLAIIRFLLVLYAFIFYYTNLFCTRWIDFCLLNIVRRPSVFSSDSSEKYPTKNVLTFGKKFV